MLDNPAPQISIVIKALNEERHIAGAVESALAALRGLAGEVVLADSASTDRTVEIARRYPIKIVQLARPEDRSCGAGVQLGYQHARGDYVCLMDGDMRLDRDFVRRAAAYLDRHPRVAGVGGLVTELEIHSLEFIKRAAADRPDLRPGIVPRLDGGGLYRRAAIEDVGYLADRNLHGGEELELGARLYAHGWTLARIDAPAIEHFGHPGSAYRLLWRRLTSRMATAAGELVRAAVGQPHFWRLVTSDRTFALWTAVHGWWLALLLAAVFVPGVLPRVAAVAALALFPVLVMSLRCRSLALGLYSVTAWNVYTLGLLPGLLRRRVAPTEPLASVVVQEAPAQRARAAQAMSEIPMQGADPCSES